MFIIGITGGIGSGKSTAASFFSERGVLVLDADAISRKVTGPGGRSIEPIRELLGERAVDSHGALNRKYTAELVFSNRTLLDKLSSVIHCEVLREIAEEIEKEEKKGTKLLVLDVPIPVKKGFLDICDQIWVVSADEEVRLDRLMQRGMSKEDARRRMDMQMTRDEYEALGDIVVPNNGDKEELNAILEKHVKDELGKRGIRI